MNTINSNKIFYSKENKNKNEVEFALDANGFESTSTSTFDEDCSTCEIRVAESVEPKPPRTIAEKLFPTMHESAASAKQLADAFSGLGPDIRETLSQYQKSAGAISEAAEHFTSLIENMKESLKAIPLVQPFLCKILEAVAILYDVVMALVNKIFYTVPTLIIRLFQLFGVDTILIRAFTKNLINTSISIQTVEESEVMERHGGGIIDMVTDSLGTLLLGQKPTLDQLRYVNEVMRYKGNLVGTFKDLASLTLYLVKSIPDQVQVWLTYIIPTKWWLRIFAPGSVYYDWIDEVNQLDEHDYTIRAAFEFAIQEKITRLYKTGQELLKECAASTRVAQVFRLLESTFKKIDTLYKIVDMSAMTTVMRRVPFVVYLYGETGQGKSFISTILPAILLNCPHDTPNLSYSRNAAIAYWDGYKGQAVVQYDDYGAIANANVTPGENAEIMTIVSNEQMRLPMADLSEKGEVFRSKILILSSNMAYITPNEMRDVTALWRRRDVFVKVEVKAQYRMRGQAKVDPNLIPDDYSHWNFFEMEPTRNLGTGRRMNYQEFIAYTREKYREHWILQDRAATNYEKMIEVANRPNAPEMNIIPNPLIREVIPDGFEPPPDNVMEVHGLAEDFRRIVGNDSDCVTGNLKTDPAPKQFNSFYTELLRIDREAERPAWVSALEHAMPIFGVACASMTLCYGIYKYASHRKEQEQTKQEEILTKADKKALASVSRFLESEEGEVMDKEGRWRRLFTDIKGATPWMVDLWDHSLSDSEFFDNLTDDEVEETIDRVLRSPRIAKLMQKEGIYSAHHYGTKRTHNQFRPQVRTGQMVKEGCIDENAMEVTTNRLVPHLALVKLGGNSMVGTLVSGRIILVPHHLFFDFDGYPFEEGVTFTVTVGTSKYQMLYDPEKMKCIGVDVALYELDACVPVFKDTTKFFIKEEDLQLRRVFPALIATVTPFGIPMIVRTDSNVSGNTSRWLYSLDNNEEKAFQEGRTRTLKMDTRKTHEIMTAWYYEMQTQKGMCGSPIVQLDKFAARKIVGFHIAGTRDGKSLGQVITQEMIDNGLKSFGIHMQPWDPKTNLPADKSVMQVQGNFRRIGRLEKPIFINETTKIVPSIVHGQIYPVKTLPAVMRKDDIRSFKAKNSSPLRTGVEKYGQIAPLVDNTILAEVGEHVFQTFNGLETFCPKRILTEKEALNGVQGDEFITKMDMSTSSGYPWNQQLNAKGKSPFIEREGDVYRVVDKDLRRKIDQRWESALHGRRVESLWLDTLKDERRPFEKTIEGKTRVFTIPPVDFTIVARRLFSAFSSCFYNNKLRYFSAVGIDPMSLEWTILFQKLETMSHQGFGGDYSGWDGNLNPQFLMEICNIINKWYDDEEQYQIARRVIFDELIHTPQCAMDLVYYTDIGNPSGNPLTVILNTIYNAMQKRYIFLLVAPPEHRSLQYFENNITDVNYGDDDLNAVKDEALQFFNPLTLSAELTKLNMVYTSAEKNGLAEIKPISELTFLKRGFRKNERGHLLPTIDPQTITELTNWTRQNAAMTVEEATIDNLNDSLGFMYAYGREAFSVHLKKIQDVLPTQLWNKLHGYRYYHSMFLSKTSDGVMEKHSLTVPADSSSPVVSTEQELPTSDNKAGTIIETQKKVELSSSTLTPKAAFVLQSACIGEPEWTYKETVVRKVWIQTFQWMAASGAGTVLFNLNLPQDAIVNYLQSMLFERFYSWRGSIRFTVTVTGMRQQMGRLQLFSVPFTKMASITNWHAINMASYYGLNSAPLDPSSSTTVNYLVPYSNPKTYIAINGPAEDVNQDYIGTLVCIVQSQLTSPSGVPSSVDVAVWAEFGEDVEFKVPINSSATGYVYNEQHRKAARQRLENMLASEFMERHGGTMSTTTNITAYGNMDGTTVPQHLTNDDFSGAASGNTVTVPAMDRAGRTWNPLNIVRKYIQNYTNSLGSELITRLDLNPSNMHISDPEHFGTYTDEMTMAFLLRNPTVSHTFTWMGSATSGTSLFSGFIGPMFELFTPGTDTQISLVEKTRVPMTQWSYNAMRHAYWKGGIKVRLEFVCTAFHVGSITIACNYGAPPGTATTLRDATSQYYKTFYLGNEKNVFNFVIPWVSQRPWLQMCRGPSSPDDVSVATSWWETYFLGSFDISVNTALRTLAAAPPDVPIFMSVSGAEDFFVYYPSNINGVFTGSIVGTEAIPLTIVGEKHGSVAGAGDDAVRMPPESKLTSGEIIQPPGSRPTILGGHFGQRAAIMTVKDEMRRYYVESINTDFPYVAQSSIASLGNDSAYGYTEMNNLVTVSTTQPQRFLLYYFFDMSPYHISSSSPALPSLNYQPYMTATPLCHYGMQYRYWGGSLRYKIIFNDLFNIDGTKFNQGQCAVTYIPHSTYSTSSSLPATRRQNLAAIAANYAPQGPLDFRSGTQLANHPTTITGVLFASDLARVEGNINYCEVEIPYTSVYNSLPTVQGLIGAQVSPNMTMAGLILVTQEFFMTSISSVPPSNIISTDLIVLKSVGDDFRFGTFLGVPNVFPLNFNFFGGPTSPWPDTWVVTSPSIPKLGRPIMKELKSSDEEFDKLEPESMTKSMLIRKFHKANRSEFMEKHGSYLSSPSGAQVIGKVKVVDFWEMASVKVLPMNAQFPCESIDNPNDVTREKRVCATKIGDFIRIRRELPMMSTLFELKHIWGLQIDTVCTTITSTSRYGHEEEISINLTFQYALPIIDVFGEVSEDFEGTCKRGVTIDFGKITERIYVALFARIIVRSDDFIGKMTEFNEARASGPIWIEKGKEAMVLQAAGLLNLGKIDFSEDKVDEWLKETQLEFDERQLSQQVMEKHGDFGEPAQPPTTANIALVLTFIMHKYETEDLFNARMAMNEFCQKIETSSYQTSVSVEGPPHIPTFSAVGVMLVENELFSSVLSDGAATNKKEALERCALDMLKGLISRIPPKEAPEAKIVEKPEASEIDIHHMQLLFPKIAITHISRIISAVKSENSIFNHRNEIQAAVDGFGYQMKYGTSVQHPFLIYRSGVVMAKISDPMNPILYSFNDVKGKSETLVQLSERMYTSCVRTALIKLLCRENKAFDRFEPCQLDME